MSAQSRGHLEGDQGPGSGRGDDGFAPFGENRWLLWIQKTSVLGINFGCCQKLSGVKGWVEVDGGWGGIASSIRSARESAALALTSTSNLQIVQICFSQFT